MRVAQTAKTSKDTSIGVTNEIIFDGDKVFEKLSLSRAC